MNTFRIFSLFALMGLATGQATAMDMVNFAQTEAPQNYVSSEVTPEEIIQTGCTEITEAPSVLPEKAQSAISTFLSHGAKVYQLSANHPWYTTGIVAIVVGGSGYVLYRTGKLQLIADFVKNHKRTTALVGTAVVGTGLAAAANHYGYFDKETVTDWASWVLEKMPTTPSISKPKLIIGAGTAAIVGTLGYLFKPRTAASQQAAPTVSGSAVAQTTTVGSSSTAQVKSPSLVADTQPVQSGQKSTQASSSAPVKPATVTPVQPTKTKAGWFSRGPSNAELEKQAAQEKAEQAKATQVKAAQEIEAGLDKARHHKQGGLTLELALEKANIFDNQELNELIRKLFGKIKFINNVRREGKIQEQLETTQRSFNAIVSKLDQLTK